MNLLKRGMFSTLRIDRFPASKLPLVALFLVSLGFTHLGFAQGVIWSNEITGTNPNTANPYTTGDVVNSPSVTVSGIGRGPGATGTNTDDRYNANSWNTVSLDPTAYFTWSLTLSSDSTIDFSSLTGANQVSPSGPTSYALRSSLDGFTADIATGSLSGTAAFNYNLSAASFDNVANSIEFRLYGWGASAANGTFSVNDFAFNGIVAIPEPTTVIGALMLVGLVGYRERRRLGSWATRERCSPMS